MAFGDGFWLGRQVTNRHATLRHEFAQLEHSGNFQNLRLAAGTATGEYRKPVFMDSDIYKWLEAVGFDLANAPDAELQQMAETAIDLLEAAVVGRVDEEWGESVHAAVVLKPGAQASAGELIAHCARSIAGYKKPRSLEIVDHLPRNAAGKILRRALR